MKVYSSFVFLFAVSTCLSSSLLAQTLPLLGDLTHYSVIADRGIENIGETIISGDVEALLDIAGFTSSPDSKGPGLIKDGSLINGISLVGVGKVFEELAVTQSKKANNLTGKILGKDILNLCPGVYTFDSDAKLTGTLKLNDHGNKNSIYIFQVNGSLTTSTFSKIIMSSGGCGLNVYWKVSDASIGAYSNFIGNVISKFNITLNKKANTTGKLWTIFGTVNLNSNSIALTKDALTDNVPEYKFLFHQSI